MIDGRASCRDTRRKKVPMALAKVKTEMTGTGGGRYTTRADAKVSANKRRRRADKKATTNSKNW